MSESESLCSDCNMWGEVWDVTRIENYLKFGKDIIINIPPEMNRDQVRALFGYGSPFRTLLGEELRPARSVTNKGICVRPRGRRGGRMQNARSDSNPLLLHGGICRIPMMIGIKVNNRCLLVSGEIEMNDMQLPFGSQTPLLMMMVLQVDRVNQKFQAPA
eukprot:Gb_10160 [translate_table: standard]